MSEQKTVKVDTGPFGSGQPNYPGGPGGGSYGGGSSWEETQYVSPDLPTPRPGEVQWPPQPTGPQEPSTWRQQPSPAGGGAPTILIPTGPKPEPAFAWLVMVSGTAGNRQLGLPLPVKSSGTTTIGRVPGNSVVVPDPACSSSHAKIRFEIDAEGKQSFVIYDLASSNGLYVGSKDSYKDESSRVYRHVLQDGNYLLIGETTLVFKQI